MKSKQEEEHRQLRDACSKATKRLGHAAEGLRKLLEERPAHSGSDNLMQQ